MRTCSVGRPRRGSGGARTTGVLALPARLTSDYPNPPANCCGGDVKTVTFFFYGRILAGLTGVPEQTAAGSSAGRLSAGERDRFCPLASAALHFRRSKNGEGQPKMREKLHGDTRLVSSIMVCPI